MLCGYFHVAGLMVRQPFRGSVAALADCGFQGYRSVNAGCCIGGSAAKSSQEGALRLKSHPALTTEELHPE
jgi:hypothetical protein